MSGLQEQIDYHAARAIEELDCAERTRLDAERRSHMELSRLHLHKAGWLRTKQPDISFGAMPLSMGEASRVVDFQEFG